MPPKNASNKSTSGKGSGANSANLKQTIDKKKTLSSPPVSSPGFRTPESAEKRGKDGAVPVKARPAPPPLPGSDASGRISTAYLQTLAHAAGRPEALSTAGIALSQPSDDVPMQAMFSPTGLFSPDEQPTTKDDGAKTSASTTSLPKLSDGVHTDDRTMTSPSSAAPKNQFLLFLMMTCKPWMGLYHLLPRRCQKIGWEYYVNYFIGEIKSFWGQCDCFIFW